MYYFAYVMNYIGLFHFLLSLIRFSTLRGEGGIPLYGLYRYVWPQRVWFLTCFGLKKGIDFEHFNLKYGMFFTPTWHWAFCLQQTNFSASTLANLSPFQMLTQMETISG